MLERDRFFLKEYFDFGHMNHVMAGLAIYNTATKSAETAAALHELVEGINPDDAAAIAKNLNTTVRIPRLALPRLFAEFVGAMEDLGALCEAVRTRKVNDGIYHRYLSNDTRDVRSFFEEIEKLPTSGGWLASLLDLPSLGELANTLSTEQLGVATKSYEVLEANLRQISRVYLRKPASFQEASTPLALSPEDWMNHSHIILDIWDSAATGKPKARDIGTVEWAYFKIKHRFVVVDDMEAFSQMANPPQSFYWTVHGLDAEAAKGLLDKTVAVAKISAELVGLVRALDDPRLLDAQ